MKKPILFIAMTAIVLSGYFFITWKNHSSNTRQEESFHRKENSGKGEKESGAAQQLSSWFQAKGFPNAQNLSAKYQAAWQEYLEIKKNTRPTGHQTRIEAVNSNWSSLGYSTTNSGTRIGGRVVCMAIDPNNSNNLWVGSAGGGMWKSTDAGSNWTNVTTNLPVLGVSSIIINPSNSNIIYAGTGEVYHTEVDVMGFNVWKTRGTYGIGVIKSIDGGVTWTQVMPKTSSDLFSIQTLAFKPGDNSTIYACATDGLYRSLNSGSTWTKIYTGNNVRDIAINPSNTNQIVISVGNMTNPVKGIFRTTNGDNASPTWGQISSGLPGSFDGYIVLDNVGSGELIASIGISSSTASSNREIYRSTNFGSTWSVVGGTTASTTTNHCSYQFWFAHTVAINPFATDSIMFGGVGIYRYRVSTTSRTSISGLHADHHDIEFDPSRRGTVYVCNDGGVYKSTNGGATFTAINNGLNATQFYASLGVSKTNANRMVGGLQDNGQVIYNGINWVQPTWSGGDGTACAIHPTNDNIMLACRDARAIKRSSNGGTSGSELSNSYWGFDGDSRTAFVAPIAFAPSNGNIVYQASDNLHKSIDAGASFTNNSLGSGAPATMPNNFIEQRHKTGVALEVSHTNENKVYISTSPFAQYDNDINNIYVTGSPNLLRTTSGGTPFTSIKGTLPDRFVMDMAISKYNDDSVYVVLGGFGTSHVYLTPNGGTTWLSRGSGLPDVPFNAILIDPVDPKIIYAGCDFGVYVSPDRGVNWYDYNTGFSDATLIMDLQLDANNKLIAATHGKGVFRSDLFTPPITLPVKFTSFTGQNNDDKNDLRWNVEEEFNVSHYELQRSQDGNTFEKIVSISAFNTPSPRTYSYRDNIGRVRASKYYYRLKAIDIDEKYYYSDIVVLKTESKNGIELVGNPFTNQVSFKYLASEAGKMRIQIADMNGRIVRKEDLNISEGIGNYTINNVGSFSKGIYILEVWINRERYTEKILKR